MPGSLGDLTTILGEVGANIVEILHQRMFVDLSARSAEIEVTIETLDHVHVERAVAALEDAGYVVRVGTFTYRDARPSHPAPVARRRLGLAGALRLIVPWATATSRISSPSSFSTSTCTTAVRRRNDTTRPVARTVPRRAAAT